MTIEEVKKFLSENADKDEVKAYLAELSKPTEETVSEIIDGFKKSKDYLSEIDRSVSKAVEAHDAKIKPKLEKEIRTKIEMELNPPKDPAVLRVQEQLDSMKQELAEAAAALAEKNAMIEKEKRTSFIYQTLKPEYKDFGRLLDDSVPDISEKVQLINKMAFELQTKGTSKPKDSKDSDAAVITRESLKNMTPAEINKARIEGKLDSIAAGNIQ